jgi:conjugative relaxase-like TrwC/TraI family protein
VHSGSGDVPVTVRVTTLKGASAGVYYVEALPNYYLDADEPRGIWQGQAAGMLGLSGTVEDEAFLALMAGLDPRDPDRVLGNGYSERSVRGFDVSASSPKSVSVLWAVGDDHVRAEVLAAHDAAVAAVAGWIEAQAHTRFRLGGEVVVVDAEGIVAAGFRQHTSRALDPQLHTHLVVANRVKSPDGRWLALDARTLKRDQRTLSALFHAAERAELTRRLGVEWGPVVNGIAEIEGIDRRVVEEFSTRTKAVTARLGEKLDRFEQTMGREPTPRERWQLEREAAVDSRPAKDHAVNAEVLHERWVDQLRDLGVDPERLVAGLIGRSLDVQVDFDVLDQYGLVDAAIDALAEQQSSWRPAEIVREIAAQLPTTLAATAGEVVQVADILGYGIGAAQGMELGPPVPAGVERRVSDGRPITESASDRAITQAWILREEAFILDWAAHGVDPAQRRSNRSTLDRCPPEANSAQRETAAAIAGTAAVVLVVGPAGTGKTTALRPAVEQLHLDGRVVFGVAPSAIAASVLTAETGVRADTIDKLLVEHRTGCPQALFDLPAGATVIVDEAGMLATPKLAELAHLAQQQRWRVALVGDPLQFSAVGRGGMFGMLVDTNGAIELDRVHRFTSDWERAASLKLRRGDPAVADSYEREGRLHGGTVEQIERVAVSAWWRQRKAGQLTLLMAPSTETVDRLNQAAQQRRIRAGELDGDDCLVLPNGLRLHVGDEIATRHNDRTLETDRHEMVRNRNTWTITSINDDWTITAQGATGTVTLPATYLCDHVELAYAITAMGAQGRTVDHAITVIDSVTDVRNLYVPMTRGRESNHAYLAIEGEDTAADVFARYLTNDWIDLPAHQRAQELWTPTGREPDWRTRAVTRDNDFGIDL